MRYFPHPAEVIQLLLELDFRPDYTGNVTGYVSNGAYGQEPTYLRLHVQAIKDANWEDTPELEIAIILGEPGREYDKAYVLYLEAVAGIKQYLRDIHYPVDRILRLKRLRALLS